MDAPLSPDVPQPGEIEANHATEEGVVVEELLDGVIG
jgi:hypothetical protein